MKKVILASLSVLALSACANTKLSDSDRALLIETRNMAEEAKQQSAMAVSEAKRARESAERAAEKADRIFKESQKK